MKPNTNQKTHTQRILLWLTLSSLLTVPAWGNYAVTWHTIDGGGRTSSGGTYSLIGTIGQPDAAYSEGGDYYELLGGFLPGAPEEQYTGPDYFQWLEVGQPNCWCFPRQCHGDADNATETYTKLGTNYQVWVGYDDLAVLIAGWQSKFSPVDANGDAIELVVCGDFDHHSQTFTHRGRSYQVRVGTDDLAILIAYWQTIMPDQPPADCQTDNPVVP